MMMPLLFCFFQFLIQSLSKTASSKTDQDDALVIDNIRVAIVSKESKLKVKGDVLEKK